MGEKVYPEKNMIESAKIFACKIQDKETRTRAYALNIAANSAAQCLLNMGLAADTKLSLFRISSFAKNFELADVYVNGFRFDVRVTFDGETFTIPKTHEKYDAVPLAYIVVKLEKSLKEADILGFVAAEDIDYERTDSAYYSFSTDILKPIEAIKSLIDSSILNIHPYSSNDHERIKELCAAFIDDEISESEKVFFIKHVIACPVCRETFCDINDFDVIVSQLKNYHELLNDSTLSVLSGNKKEFDEALLANLAYVENAPENDETTIETDNDDNLPSLLDVSDEDLNESEENIVTEESLSLPEDDTQEDLEPLEEIIDEDKSLLNSENEEEPQQESFFKVESVDDIKEDDILTDSGLDAEQLSEEIPENTLIENGEEPVSLDETESQSLLLNDDTDNVVIEQKTEELSESQISEEKLILPEEPGEEEPVLTDIPQELEEILPEGESLEELKSEDLLLHDTEEPELLQEVTQEHDLNIIEEEDQSKDNEDNTIEPLDEEAVTPIDLDDLETIDSLQETEPEEDSDVEEDILANKENIQIESDSLNTDNGAVSENAEESNSIQYPADDTDDVAEDNALESVDEEQNDYAENDEIQNLLDDDLMALLAEDSNEDSATDSQAIEENIPNVEEKSDEQDDNTEFVDDDTASDETIGSLFENSDQPQSENGEEQVFELAEEPISQETVAKTKRLAVMSGLLVVLIAAGGGFWFMNHQKSAQDNTFDSSNQGDQLFDFQNKGSDSENNEPGAVSQDINRSMTNSFSDKPAAITITKLSWQVSEKLAADASVKEYLQTAGKNIQMNLQNDLANSADVAFNNTVKISFEIAQDNTMKGMQVLESSGSDKIDEVILRSIKNTLKYVSVPKLKDYKSDYFLTLIINF